MTERQGAIIELMNRTYTGPRYFRTQAGDPNRQKHLFVWLKLTYISPGTIDRVNKEAESGNDTRRAGGMDEVVGEGGRAEAVGA